MRLTDEEDDNEPVQLFQSTTRENTYRLKVLGEDYDCVLIRGDNFDTAFITPDPRPSELYAIRENCWEKDASVFGLYDYHKEGCRLVRVKDGFAEKMVLAIVERYMGDSRLESPNFLKTGSYSAQWKEFNNKLYYKRPNDGFIMALRLNDMWFVNVRDEDVLWVSVTGQGH